jgi:hypothetical protein
MCRDSRLIYTVLYPAELHDVLLLRLWLHMILERLAVGGASCEVVE